MDKISFNRLSKDKQLILLKEEGEELAKLPSDDYLVTLYACNGFYVETYKRRDSIESLRIVALTKEEEKNRLKLYSLQIEYSNEAIKVKRIQSEKIKGTCSKCDYDWFMNGNIKLNEISCPVCESKVFELFVLRNCKICNTKNYFNLFKRIDSCSCV